MSAEPDDESFLYGDETGETGNDVCAAEANEEAAADGDTDGDANATQNEAQEGAAAAAAGEDGPDQLPPGLGEDDEGGQPEGEKADDGEEAKEGGDSDDDDSDDEDVVIDINQQQIQDVKTSYQTFGLNKAVRQPPGAAPGEKKGKFSVEEFDQVGTVQGKPAHEFDLESLEDKPWRKPGE